MLMLRSVCLSVCLSVTLVDRDRAGLSTIAELLVEITIAAEISDV